MIKQLIYPICLSVSKSLREIDTFLKETKKATAIPKEKREERWGIRYFGQYSLIDTAFRLWAIYRDPRSSGLIQHGDCGKYATLRVIHSKDKVSLRILKWGDRWFGVFWITAFRLNEDLFLLTWNEIGYPND